MTNSKGSDSKGSDSNRSGFNGSGLDGARRYDVDWLRVLAFILLIYYHIGMFYVAEWGWHVKSQYQSEFLQYLMLLVNQWRMALIFFISGFALCMVEPKISAKQLLSIRFYRVLIPLILGMYLIVPPQVYYEAVANFGYSDGYWAFWLAYIDPATTALPAMNHGELGLLTWNHLWYLAYLWCYTLLYLALRPLLMPLGEQLRKRNTHVATLFLLPVALLTVYGVWLKPIFPKTNGLFDDWYNHAIYFSIFILGYLGAKSVTNWQSIIRYRRIWLIGGLGCYVGLMIIIKSGLVVLEGPFWEGLAGRLIIQPWVYANLWFWLLAVVGYGGAYLNKGSGTLSYLNEAILPWYIVHQTIVIVLAIFLSKFALGGTIEPLVLIVATFASCALCYEIIRRVTLLRFIFGMKLN